MGKHNTFWKRSWNAQCTFPKTLEIKTKTKQQKQLKTNNIKKIKSAVLWETKWDTDVKHPSAICCHIMFCSSRPRCCQCQHILTYSSCQDSNDSQSFGCCVQVFFRALMQFPEMKTECTHLCPILSLQKKIINSQRNDRIKWFSGGGLKVDTLGAALLHCECSVTKNSVPYTCFTNTTNGINVDRAFLWHTEKMLGMPLWVISCVFFHSLGYSSR